MDDEDKDDEEQTVLEDEEAGELPGEDEEEKGEEEADKEDDDKPKQSGKHSAAGIGDSTQKSDSTQKRLAVSSPQKHSTICRLQVVRRLAQ